MNLLLDTQLVLWTAFWPSRIPRQAAQAIKRASSVYISSVSVFEIALKASIGKLNIPFREFEIRLATSSGAQRLSLTWEHAWPNGKESPTSYVPSYLNSPHSLMKRRPTSSRI